MDNPSTTAHEAAKKKRKRSTIRPTYGSIRSKHNAWFWEYYAAPGQRKMERIGSTGEYRSKKDVAAEINKRIAQRGPVNTQKDSPRTGNVLIADFAKNVYLTWAKEQLRPATYSGYKKIFDLHLQKHFGQRKLHDYMPYMATEFLSGLARAGQGKNTIAHIRAVMSGIFAHAVSLGHLMMNPIHGAKLMNKPKAAAPTEHYELSEMALILAALDSDETARHHSIMALAFIGLRRAEISGLRWEDIDLAAGSLHVQRSAWQGTVAEGAKNSQSVRVITLGDVAANSLRRLQRVCPSIKGYVFENGEGNPQDLGLYSTRVLRPALKARGVKCWKGYHSGRRGAETEMMRYTNGNSQITSHHFGHSKEVADAHYAKPLPDATKAAALAFDAALSKALADNSGQTVQ